MLWSSGGNYWSGESSLLCLCRKAVKWQCWPIIKFTIWISFYVKSQFLYIQLTIFLHRMTPQELLHEISEKKMKSVVFNWCWVLLAFSTFVTYIGKNNVIDFVHNNSLIHNTVLYLHFKCMMSRIIQMRCVRHNCTNKFTRILFTWNVPIFSPNCTRSWAYLNAISQAACIRLKHRYNTCN